MIWDSLLERMIGESKLFLPALIKCMLRAVPSGGQGDAAVDVDAEALCMWLLHIVELADVASHEHTARTEILSWCCTHPGHWAYHLGRQLVESGDPEFQADWRDIVEASQIGQTVSFSAAIPAGGGRKTRAMSEHVVDSPTVERALSGTDEELGSWVRSATPLGRPIGVA
jgi:hypothetical protein